MEMKRQMSAIFLKASRLKYQVVSILSMIKHCSIKKNFQALIGQKDISKVCD